MSSTRTINIFQGDLETSAIQSHNDKIDLPFRIINIVALGILTKNGVSLNLDLDSLKFDIETKRLNRFPCVQFKVNGIAVILFKNGKIVLTGIKKKSTISLLKTGIEAILKSVNIEYDDFKIEIQNLVVMTNLNKNINLELTCLTLQNCLYEPEQFPAAIVKPKHGGTFLIFSNSKIIGLGMRSLNIVNKSLTNLIQDIYDKNLFVKPVNFDSIDLNWDDDFEFDV